MRRANLEAMNLSLKASLIAFILAIVPSGLKVGLLKLGGANIGRKVRIGFGTIIMAGKFSNITIGDYTEIRNFSYIICKEINIGKYVFIGMNVWIWGAGKLTLRNKVNIGSQTIIDLRQNNFYAGEFSGLGPGSIVYTHTHAWPYTHGWTHRLQDVVFEDWVMGALKIVVLPGVTVGRNSIIGAGAVVTRNIPPNSFAAGVPAKVVSSVENFRDKVDSEELKKRTIEIAKDYIDFFDFKLISEEHLENMELLTFERAKLFSKKVWKILITDTDKTGIDKIANLAKDGNLILFSTTEVPPEVARQITLWFDVKNLRCCDLKNGFAEDIWDFLANTWEVVCDIQNLTDTNRSPSTSKK